MGMFTTDIKNLDDLFVHTLQDIYYAEQKIANGLGKMIDKASDGELKRGFQQHQAETRNHVMRLEEVFKLHGQTPKAIDCPAAVREMSKVVMTFPRCCHPERPGFKKILFRTNRTDQCALFR